MTISTSATTLPRSPSWAPGMINNPGVASDMFEALYNAGININMISTSEIKVSVLVDIDDADRAVQVVHDKFFKEFGE